MPFKRCSSRHRKRRGSALLLALFSIAALLTLATTYIGISVGESKQSLVEKNALLSRQVSILGINWATSYMSYPQHWVKTTLFDPTSATPLYILSAPNGATTGPIPNQTWLGHTFTFDTPTLSGPPNSIFWSLNMNGNDIAVGTDFTAQVGIVITKMGDTPTTLRQPMQYTVAATSHLFRNGDSSNEVATRTVVARIRPETVADYALFEQNTRTWDAPGFNIYYPPVATKDVNYTTDIGQYNTYSSLLAQPVGIPANYTMNGDFRVDGSSDQFSAYAGDIHVFPTQATGADSLATIRFNGVTSFEFGQSNLYDASGVTDANSGIFLSAPAFTPMKGLPSTADYMATDNADGTAHQPTGRWSAIANTPPVLPNVNGYIKVSSTSNTDFLGVDTTAAPPAIGANVEYDTSPSASPNHKTQPGFANVIIVFANGNVTVQKLGAYSGAPVPDPNALVNGQPVPVTQLQNQLIYVDGGNVQVKGQVPTSVTIVAGASTDRPTVDSNGILIDYTNPAVLANLTGTIYLPVTDPRWTHQGGNPSLPIDNIPYVDPATNRAYWPAWDPNTAGLPPVGGDVTNMAPVVREGNLTVVSDLVKATGSSGSVGLVAQNTIYLSDQRPGSTTLQVDGVLMSLQHSVQYGGFMGVPTANTGPSDYWKNTAGPNLHRPATFLSVGSGTPGTLQFTGSIIGSYADVESTTAGIGYTIQQFSIDPNLRNNLPPYFPAFNRTPGLSVVYIILAWSDQGSLQAQ